jgi:multiple sugar transport system substrate-binding protein
MYLISRMQWKSLTILSILALPAGCQRVLPTPEPPPYHGVTLRVSAPAGAAELVRVQSRAWAGRQEARVEVVVSPAEKPAEGADVWVVPPVELPRWAAAGRLLTVPPALAERGGKFDWNGLLPLYREQLLAWDKKTFGLPLAGEAPVCVYRADLFASKEHQEKFLAWAAARKSRVEFRPPASWEEFATLAEFFRDHHPSGKPSPSLPALPADPAALDRLYYQVAASFARRAIRSDEDQPADPLAELFAFHYDLKAGTPRVATPGFVAALMLLARLQACRPAGASPDPAKAFLDGNALLAITGASVLTEAQKRPALRDKVGVAAVPGADKYYTPAGAEKSLKEGVNRVPYLGGAGWLGLVTGSSRQPEAAWDLLADLAGPTRAGQAALEPRFGGGPTRAEQVLRERWDSFDLDAARSQALKEAVGRTVMQHGLKNPVVCLRIPEEASHRAVMDAALRRVLLEKADPAKALEGVAKEWMELDLKRGKAAQLEEYRVSLGLSRN